MVQASALAFHLSTGTSKAHQGREKLVGANVLVQLDVDVVLVARLLKVEEASVQVASVQTNPVHSSTCQSLDH